MSEELARSVQTRLVRHAKSVGVDPNFVLARYATERFLYRISRSDYADRFVLKGALLLLVWLGETIRPTRDADFLGFGEFDDAELVRTMAEICVTSVEPDAVLFDPESIRVAPIRRGDPYGGQRVTLLAHLGPARLRVQLDIGIGDAVSPQPEWLDYPSLLDLPKPRIRAYRPETAIAEKVHAMVILGSKNSRMRDFFDIQALAARMRFDGPPLAESLSSTFARRGSPIPTETPLALTPEFAAVDGKRAQWKAFLRRSRLDGVTTRQFEAVVKAVGGFVWPVLQVLSKDGSFEYQWPPGGPWFLKGRRADNRLEVVE